MKALVCVCLISLAAVALGTASAEIAVPVEKPVDTDGTACIFANGIMVDRVPCSAGQQSVTWRGTDVTGNVDFSVVPKATYSAVPLNGVTIPSDDPKAPAVLATGWIAVTLDCAPGKDTDVIALTTNAADTAAGQCRLRLSVDFVPSGNLTTAVLPHTLQWSTRGLLPGSHIVTIEVFDSRNNVGTSSVMLHVKGKE